MHDAEGRGPGTHVAAQVAGNRISSSAKEVERSDEKRQRKQRQRQIATRDRETTSAEPEERTARATHAVVLRLAGTVPSRLPAVALPAVGAAVL